MCIANERQVSSLKQILATKSESQTLDLSKLPMHLQERVCLHLQKSHKRHSKNLVNQKNNIFETAKVRHFLHMLRVAAKCVHAHKNVAMHKYTRKRSTN